MNLLLLQIYDTELTSINNKIIGNYNGIFKRAVMRIIEPVFKEQKKQ